MAGNSKTLKDDFDDYPDWIELYNASDSAVNLNGWSLTDNTNSPALWRFPATNLNAHAFLVVFASNKDRRVPGAPLHTNFKLDAGGEYLALVKPDGTTRTTEFAPAFPRQYPDVSYGIGQTTTLLPSNAPARILIPAEGPPAANWATNTFDDSAWRPGTNGVGYETVVPGFAVRVVKANGIVDSLDSAEALLATPSDQAAVYGETAPVINYVNSGSGANYGDDRLFPGLVGDVEDYVMEATATVTIPWAGEWTFGVNSDDGFGLQVGDFSMSYPWPRGPGDTLQTFYFNEPGQYPLRLVFYERGGGSEVEFWAGPGALFWFDPSSFRLVGDTDNGGLEVTSIPATGGSGGGYRADIHTDVESEMLNQQVSAHVRIPFAVANAASVESLTLKIKYDDGFVAYLNGVEVARRNVPASAAWNTPAPKAHAGSAYELIDITSYRSKLREGENLLAILALNKAADDSDFLVLAELVEFRIAGGTYSYMSPATPGVANVTGYPGLAEPVQFPTRGGVFTTNVSVTLLSPTPKASIRYTLDNQLPAENSTLYTKPILLTGSAAIRARAFAPGLLPSQPVTEAYTLLDKDVVSFSSRLPLLVVESYGSQISPDMAQRVGATLTVLDTVKSTGRATLLGKSDYHGRIGIEGRGQTSQGFDKKPYNVELWDESDQDQRASLLGMPADSDWVLLNLYNDKTFMNDFLAHELFEKMGHYAVRRQYVEVFLNGTRPNGSGDPSTKVSYDDYVGIYLLLEKIKVGKGRVDIAKLSPTDTAEPAISGGYMFKKDKDSPGDVNFWTSSGQTLKFHDPKGSELTPAQQSWLIDYIDRFETALYGSLWKDPLKGYANYIDVDSFVDMHWIVEFTKQIDGYRLSNFMSKDRGGKIKMEPIWDWNLSFGNADYYDCQYPGGWYWPIISSYDHIWLRRLIAEPGDPDFNQKIIDRWSVLRTNVLSATKIVARMDDLAALLDEAKTRDFNRWPRLGGYVWPNPPAIAQATTYEEVLTWVKGWILDRYAWIDSQHLPLPTLSLAGGPIQPGVGLTISALKGAIYYTLDGTDPRRSGGAIAANAVKYTAPITLSGNARVFTRAYLDSTWSGPAAVTYYTQIPQLVISELMYHPAAPLSGTNTVDDFQFIELMNAGTNTLNLAGFRFVQGIEFAFATATMAPGQRVVLVSNRAAFESRYGVGINVGGVFTNSLSHTGERLVLVGPVGEPILDFSYDSQWYPITDGLGFSLIIVNEQAALDTWASGSGWRVSGTPGGSPGAADSPITIPGILVNEALTATTPPQVDAVELYNPTTCPANLGGWFLSDDSKTPRKYVIPNGTIIPAGGYLVFDETQFGGAGTNAFAFSSLGDEVYLFSGNGVDLTGYQHGFAVGPSASGVSFGRYETSVDTDFVAMSAPTLLAANSFPLVGPVVINEIMYNPPLTGTNNNTIDEFIELRNLTSHPVPLFDPAWPTNTWRLRGGADFDFPTNLTLAAGAYLLVVNFDPVSNPSQLTAFRAKYGVAASLLVLGPYQGNLANEGERLRLYQPNPPEGVLSSKPGLVPYVLVEEVRYSPDAPWPSAADGTGRSLQRRTGADYGNDPVNWVAASPTPGIANSPPAETTPSLTMQPQSQALRVGEAVTFTASASGANPLLFQWRFNGTDIPGATNASLTLSPASTSNVGRYALRVSNPYGAALSAQAHLQDRAEFVDAERLVGGGVVFSFAGAPGAAYVFDASEDLTVWTALSTNTLPTSGTLRITNLPVSLRQLFLRGRQGP